MAHIFSCSIFSLSRKIAGLSLLVMVATADKAAADQGFFIGDSIAAATAQTLGIGGVARHSVSLRRKTIQEHFQRIPKGAVALMSLGLNDAAIPVKAMHKDIEQVIAGAMATGERVVWIGPPCVMKKWDNRAAEMDAYLAARLATTTIQYVSLRDSQICQRTMRSSDGEHFTIAGYRYVWQKIQRDSKFAALVELSQSKAAPRVVRYKLVSTRKGRRIRSARN